MNRKLKQSAREHIESFSLNDDQIQELEAMSRNYVPQRRVRPPILYWSLAGAVAVFLLALILTPLIIEHKDVHQRIALEVATNHIKLKPLEIETASIATARAYFDKLDFIPVSSTLVNKMGLELTGGRYCSLQGIAAAQLRVKQPGSDTLQTLYQTEYRKDVFETVPALELGEQPIELYAKGIRVRIWSEKGLLFALAEPPQE